MTTRPKYDDFDNAGGDLEENLNAIDQIADALDALGDETPKTVLMYLADRLREHRTEAMDAFSRIYGLDGGTEKGDAA
jgi:hypothetical protein